MEEGYRWAQTANFTALLSDVTDLATDFAAHWIKILTLSKSYEANIILNFRDDWEYTIFVTKFDRFVSIPSNLDFVALVPQSPMDPDLDSLRNLFNFDKFGLEKGSEDDRINLATRVDQVSESLEALPLRFVSAITVAKPLWVPCPLLLMVQAGPACPTLWSVCT